MASLRSVVRLVLGAVMTFAGVSHLTFARDEFQAQVPSWFPLGTDVTVLASGVAEIGLGASFLARSAARVGRSGVLTVRCDCGYCVVRRAGLEP